MEFAQMACEIHETVKASTLLHVHGIMDRMFAGLLRHRSLERYLHELGGIPEVQATVLLDSFAACGVETPQQKKERHHKRFPRSGMRRPRQLDFAPRTSRRNRRVSARIGWLSD